MFHHKVRSAFKLILVIMIYRISLKDIAKEKQELIDRIEQHNNEIKITLNCKVTAVCYVYQ